MAEPRLIRDYRAQLDELLPPTIAEELADGLEQTYHRHLSAGLGSEAAARAAAPPAPCCARGQSSADAGRWH